MDISLPGDSNAILLAISSILQQVATANASSSLAIVAELSQTLSTISSDISIDGSLDMQKYIDDISLASQKINPFLIKNNLENRYLNLGQNVVLPDLEHYLDNDGDGIININDPDYHVVITINPYSIKITDASSSTTTSTQHFTITVKNENGIPLKDGEIWISYVWAVPNSFGVLQLYDGDDPEDSPMNVKTDENGAYNLRFDFQSGGGLEYSADIQVSYGSVFGSATFSVESGS